MPVRSLEVVCATTREARYRWPTVTVCATAPFGISTVTTPGPSDSPPHWRLSIVTGMPARDESTATNAPLTSAALPPTAATAAWYDSKVLPLSGDHAMSVPLRPDAAG